MKRPFARLASILVIAFTLVSCEPPLTAAVNICFNFPKENGDEALAFLHQSFAKQGWRYSTFHPQEDKRVFMTKADANGTWIQLQNTVSEDMVVGSVYSFEQDRRAAVKRVSEIRDWFRSLRPPRPSNPKNSRPCGPNNVPIGSVEWGWK